MAETEQSAPQEAKEKPRREREPKTKHTPPNDVAKEPYRGPGWIVTTSGYLYITHMLLFFSAIAVGFGAGYIFHKPAKGIIEGLRGFAAKAANPISKAIGTAITWFVGEEKAVSVSALNQAKILEHLPEGLHKPFKEWALTRDLGIFQKMSRGVTKLFGRFSKADSAQAVLVTSDAAEEAVGLTKGDVASISGGFVGLLTWAVSGVWSLVHGSKQSNRGKTQFERAKDDIWTLRAEYDDLRQKYLDTKLDLEDAKTLKDSDTGELTISPDNPPKITPPVTEPVLPQDAASEVPPKTPIDAGEKPKPVVSNIVREAALAQRAPALAT